MTVLGQKEGSVFCQGCGTPLRAIQIQMMLGNPKYTEWCREGYCSFECFTTYHGKEPESASEAHSATFSEWVTASPVELADLDASPEPSPLPIHPPEQLFLVPAGIDIKPTPLPFSIRYHPIVTDDRLVLWSMIYWRQLLGSLGHYAGLVGMAVFFVSVKLAFNVLRISEDALSNLVFVIISIIAALVGYLLGKVMYGEVLRVVFPKTFHFYARFIEGPPQCSSSSKWLEDLKHLSSRWLEFDRSKISYAAVIRRRFFQYLIVKTRDGVSHVFKVNAREKGALDIFAQALKKFSEAPYGSAKPV